MNFFLKNIDIFFNPRTKHKIFALKKKKHTRNNYYGGINKLPNAKKRFVLALKLRPMKTFRGAHEKMLLYRREGSSTTAERHGGSYI